MYRHLSVALCLFFGLSAACGFAQEDKREVRAGNRIFDKAKYKESEIEYRKALVKDSTSFAATYDLASCLYRQKEYDAAGKMLAKISESAEGSGYAARYHFNSGDVALQQKDYGAAVKAFREALLKDPADMKAKENYIYAKMMQQQQQQQQNQDQNQDQDQQQNQNQQNQNQDQNKDQNQPQDNRDQSQKPQEQKITPQQAQQMLKAMQAKEKETQEKVEKEKAAALKARQKEKNW